MTPRGRPPPPEVARELYERFYEGTVRQIAAITGNIDLAVEASQEAYVRAFERFDTLRDRRKFPAWVAAIALNITRDMLRQRRKESPDREPGSVSNVILLRSGNPAGDKSVKEEVLDREQKKALVEAVRGLPEGLKEVVVFYYVHDLDVKSIAELFGIPEGTVKSRLHRAKALLRKAIVAPEYGALEPGEYAGFKDGEG